MFRTFRRSVCKAPFRSKVFEQRQFHLHTFLIKPVGWAGGQGGRGAGGQGGRGAGGQGGRVAGVRRHYQETCIILYQNFIINF